jgi:hypothetical protein
MGERIAETPPVNPGVILFHGGHVTSISSCTRTCTCTFLCASQSM